MPSVSVKGKEDAISLYAVVNIPSETEIPGAGSRGPATLNEVRAMLGLPVPDFHKVDLDAEERKYTIQS